MSDLFDKRDILTGITADQAVKGDKGYFGDTLSDLYTAIELRAVMTLSSVDQAKAYCFKTNNDQDQYTLFLPLGRVKKTYTYRPIANLDELLEFLVPDLDVNDVCDSAGNNAETSRYEKAKLLLGKQITIREKQSAYTTVLIIDRVDFYGDSDTCDAIHINGSQLNFLFECYEILIDGEWVPFGVRDYNEN